MAERKTICIVSFSPIAVDARLLRHLKFLGAQYDLICIGYGNDPSPLLPGVNLRWRGIVKPPRKQWLRVLRTLMRWPGRIFPPLDWLPFKMMGDWRKAYEIVMREEFDMFLGNDVMPLLLGISRLNRRGTPMIMDYHEYAPLEGEENVRFRLFHGPHQFRLLRRYGKRAVGSLTVNAQFATRFEKEFGFPTITVMNAPELLPMPVPGLRTDSRIHLVFHGNAAGGRNLKTLLRALQLLDDRFVLHLMLINGAEAGSPYRQLAEALPAGRVVFEETVAPSQTAAKISNWDIGFNILQPLNYNHNHALPNKLFDYIHAGLGVVCSDTVTGRDFVEKYGIGWVVSEITPESIAALLKSITPDEIAARKAASLQLRNVIHAAGEEGKLVELTAKVLAAT